MTAVLQFYSNSQLYLFPSAGIDHLIGCEKFFPKDVGWNYLDLHFSDLVLSIIINE